MHHLKRVRPRVKVLVPLLSLLAVLAFAAPAFAGTYDSAVLADSPSMYWRFGEDDGATTAVDASGHGRSLTYASGALLGQPAGIGSDSNRSLAGSFTQIASASVAGASTPAAVELWLRTDLPTADATLYTFTAAGGTKYNIKVGTDGLLHATIVVGEVCCDTTTIDGPSSIPVTDGQWHYVVVDFADSYVYVDQTPGPMGGAGGGGIPLAFGADVFGTASVSIGGPSFGGQIDELAHYDDPLTSGQMSTHSTDGGFGWDAIQNQGGEEGAPFDCPELGVFHKGSKVNARSALPADNYFATAVLNYITTTFQSSRCGFGVPLPPQPNDPGYPRPTFLTGQTVRVKTARPSDENYEIKNYYVEWGPIQYKCSKYGQTCYGLFFNMKATDTYNDVCWVPFRQDQYNFVKLENCPAIPSDSLTEIRNCGVGTGTHGWKLTHNSATSEWEARFLCITTNDNANHDSASWKLVFRHTDAPDGHHYTQGWPDMEGFVHGLSCSTKARDVTHTCWTREGFMAETHSSIRHYENGAWRTQAYTVCRKDDSLRWDGDEDPPGSTPVNVWKVKQVANGETCEPPPE